MSCNNTALLTKGGGHSKRPHSAPLPNAVPRSDKGLKMKIDSGVSKRSSSRVQEKNFINAFNAIGLNVKKEEKPSGKPSLTIKLQNEINILSSKLETHKKNLEKNLSELNEMYTILNAVSATGTNKFKYGKIFYTSKEKFQVDIENKLRLISKLKVYINKIELEIIKQSGILDDYTFNKEINSMTSLFGATNLSPVNED